MTHRLLEMPALAALLPLILAAGAARATPEVYEMECAFCHVDDTPTCAGCHNHHVELSAAPERSPVPPGATVTVRVSGAELPGWIRAILYDQDWNELDRLTGPTGTGDDGHGPAVADSVVASVRLRGRAPATPGTYTWYAAYFGVFDVREAGHGETWTAFSIAVSDTLPPDVRTTWAGVKGRYVMEDPGEKIAAEIVGAAREIR